jgi:hypothetical protein
LKVYGTASIADVLGDFVAYRGLRPADVRLPGLEQIAPGPVPRKGSAEYARVAVALLRAAQQLARPGVELRRLVFVGDTRMSDGGAFTTMRAASGWDARCFIGRDDPNNPEAQREGDVTYAGSWAALHFFAAALEAEEFLVDEATAVVVDLDKTFLGARGRNDRLIDQARLRALRDSVAGVLGARFDAAEFERIYRTVDTARFHTLTEDNQDYVGYLCVIVAGKVFSLGHLEQLVDRGVEGGSRRLLAMVEEACEVAGWPSPAIERFHDDFARPAAAGDPTPFKDFRRREFVETAALMGRLPEDVDAVRALAEELVITAEVWQVARGWQEQDAVLFGLSDKPDEAAMPSDEDAARGVLPLHRVRTQIVGT